MRAFKHRYCNNTAICSSRIKSEVTINGGIKELHIIMISLLVLLSLSQIASAELRTRCYWLMLFPLMPLYHYLVMVKWSTFQPDRKSSTLSVSKRLCSTPVAPLSEPWLRVSWPSTLEQVAACSEPLTPSFKRASLQDLFQFCSSKVGLL